MIVKINKLDHQGRGITNIEGKIAFVPFALPDEEVEVEITKEYPKYLEAKLIKIIKPSSKRIESKCSYYKDCGGCSLQHLNYQDYLDTKKEQLINIFERYLNIKINPIIIDNPSPYNYRNKISLKVVNKKIGFYQDKSNDLVEIKECLIVDKEINRLLKSIDTINIKNGNLVIRINDKKEILLIINSKDKISINNIVKEFKIVGIIQNDELIYGKDYFIQDINNYKFKINYNSFFQTNDYINSKLLNLLKENTLGNLNVLDLFCGVGSLGLSIASKSNCITGIDIIPEAILNAKENAKLNNITNATYEAKDALKVDLNDYKNIDLIIIDPPRSGLSNNITNNINSKYLIYISCDPMTLTRDLKILKDKYDIEKIYMLDMFSYTKHVECFVKLIRK